MLLRSIPQEAMSSSRLFHLCSYRVWPAAWALNKWIQNISLRECQVKENLGPSELQLPLMPLPFCSPMGGTDVCPITTGLRAQLLAATGPSPTQALVTWWSVTPHQGAAQVWRPCSCLSVDGPWTQPFTPILHVPNGQVRLCSHDYSSGLKGGWSETHPWCGIGGPAQLCSSRPGVH